MDLVLLAAAGAAAFTAILTALVARLISARLRTRARALEEDLDRIGEVLDRLETLSRARGLSAGVEAARADLERLRGALRTALPPGREPK